MDDEKGLFSQKGDKAATMTNSVDALAEAQKAFQGVADDLGVSDEQDVVDMVKQIRAERSRAYLKTPNDCAILPKAR